jgi:DNA invertase Pin-like site-specific DNA recombinase
MGVIELIKHSEALRAEGPGSAGASIVLSFRIEEASMLHKIDTVRGYSGGTMERPALKRLLTDVEANKVNVIVVYKVDRLTRSLSDFAKIVEALDARGVSFVSVTQQFNTTSSMGRLTLNILLSFAQFEREVTVERIRDKIAASKKKGMWMGGLVPLGYDLEGRKLVPNSKESEVVCKIFGIYLKVGCVSKLAVELDRENVKSKSWVSRLENWAQLSELTKMTRSSNGMMTVERDATNRRSRRLSPQPSQGRSLKVTQPKTVAS